jgi:putative acetyltransferase
VRDPVGVEASIREEGPGDVSAIRRVNEEAFGQPQEARLVERLRANHGVLLSLVALVDGHVVGHILYSPVRLGDGDQALHGAGLGPMAVLPAFQGTGIGSKLVTEGTDRLRRTGCPFIVVLGHPRYYRRFGFVPASRHGVRCQWDAPDEAFMLLPLDPSALPARPGVARFRDEFLAVA